MMSNLLNSLYTVFIEPFEIFYLEDVNIDDFLKTDEKTKRVMQDLRCSDAFDRLLKSCIRYGVQDISISASQAEFLDESHQSKVNLKIGIDKWRAIQVIKLVYVDSMSEEEIQFAIIYNIALSSLQSLHCQNWNSLREIQGPPTEIQRQALEITQPIIASDFPALQNYSSRFI